MGYYPGSWSYGYGGFNWLSLLISIFFWGLIIVGVVALFKALLDSNEESRVSVEKEVSEKTNKYLDIVKERYARGEINKKEYDQLKKDFS